MDLKKPLLKDSYDPENPQNWKSHLAGEPIKVRKTKFEISNDGNPVQKWAKMHMPIGLGTRVLRQNQT